MVINMKKIKSFLAGLGSYPYILFALFFVVVFAFDMTATNRSYSELENRYLAKKPQFTFKSLFANEYTANYEKYINDQLIWRDNWIDLKSRGELVLGKIENNGIVYGKDGYMFEKYIKLNQEQYDRNMKFFTEFLQKYPDRNLTTMIVPNAYAIMPERIPAQLQNIDQSALIGQVLGVAASNGSVTVDPSKALAELAQSGYAYYRTDHHWTSYGAYAAYVEYCNAAGVGYVSLEELQDYAWTKDDFYGTYFSKSKAFFATPDSMLGFNVPFSSMTVSGVEKETLNDMSKLEERDKYASYIWGNNGVTVIKSSINKNHADGQTSRVLLIKDSFGNSFAPFLCASYDEVVIVDMRSSDFRLSELVAEYNFDDMLFLYNFSNFATDGNFARLRY